MTVIYPPGEEDQFIEALIKDSDDVTKAIADMQPHKAECFSPKDLEMIQYAVETSVRWSKLKSMVVAQVLATTRALGNMAIVYQAQADLRMALETLQRSLDIEVAAYGSEDHLNVAMTLDKIVARTQFNMADCLEKMGDLTTEISSPPKICCSGELRGHRHRHGELRLLTLSLMKHETGGGIRTDLRSNPPRTTRRSTRESGAKLPARETMEEGGRGCNGDENKAAEEELLGDMTSMLFLAHDSVDEVSSLKDKAKDTEEIERLTLPEGMSDADKVKEMVKSEHALQQIALLNLLPRALRQTPGEGQEALLDLALPALGKFLQKEFVNDQVTREEVFRRVTQVCQEVDSVRCRMSLLRTALQFAGKTAEQTTYGHSSHEDRDIINGLIEIVRMVSTPKDSTCRGQLLARVEQDWRARSKALDSTGSRCLASRLCGVLLHGEVISRRSKPQLDSIGQALVTFAKAQAQDVEPDVRASICEQLPLFAVHMEAEHFQAHLLEDYWDLLGDEDFDVRVAAVVAFERIVSDLQQPKFLQEAVPRLIKMVREATEVLFDPVRSYNKVTRLAHTVVKQLGPMIFACRDVINTQLGLENSPLERVLGHYCKLANSEDAQLRLQCAFNFPGILAAVGGNNFAKHLHTAFKHLCGDESEAVRATMAKSIAAVAEILGSQRMVRHVFHLFCKLLQDHAAQVRRALMPRLTKVVSSFRASNASQQTVLYEQMFPALAQFIFPEIHTPLRHDWRFRVQGLDHLCRFGQHLPSRALHDLAVPLLLEEMRRGCVPMRAAALQTLCWLMRHNACTSQEVHLVHDIKSEFCRSKSSAHRALFVQFCEIAAESFPAEFAAKFRLQGAVLDLLEDNVPNVRLAACVRLPNMVSHRLITWETAVERLQGIADADTDRDVKDAAQKSALVLREMDLSKTGHEDRRLPHPRAFGPARMVVATVDVGCFARATSPRVSAVELSAEELATVAAWHKTMTEAGFAMIVNHGLEEDVRDMLRVSKAFFLRSMQDKMKFNHGEYGNSRGGFCAQEAVGRSLNQEQAAAPPDLVESYVINPAKQAQEDHDATVWDHGARYHAKATGLMHTLHRMSALALGKEPGFFDEFHNPPHNILRLAHYPPLPEHVEDGQLRYGAHTDYTGFTILAIEEGEPGQPSGLEVFVNEEWHEVTCPPGALIVNIGDLFSLWTSNKWVSTLHRVRNPPKGSVAASRHRFSLPFFTGPRSDAIIRPIESTDDSSAVQAGAYLQKKLSVTRV
ncbi:Serine/threonine-protein phosphatase 4 regulatory subunit 4 [Durusdinium trenchii]|uniref:Serine/threonine-protein phosphatase 4 regulatory subunit 4 n=1 Tax=Durusdinium trenchii TaxID=1381693 RepID=A0ABP0QSD9_9DINO